MLPELYPPPSQLIKMEAYTLSYLKDNPYILEEHPQFAKIAAMVHRQIDNGSNGFNFEAYLDVEHERETLRLFAGGRVVPKSSSSYSEITYCLTVCRRRGSRLVIRRKFHFDVAIPGGPARQEHFLFHAQYCGKLSPYLRDQGLSDTHMYPRLSEPRLFFSPVSLALLLDAIFHEFPDSRSRKFRRAPEWQSIIRANQKLVLGPFYKKCANIIADPLGDHKVLADVFDVK